MILPITSPRPKAKQKQAVTQKQKAKSHFDPMNERSHENEERNKAKVPIQKFAGGIVQGFSITPRGNLQARNESRLQDKRKKGNE
jgi:hypothetical protein